MSPPNDLRDYLKAGDTVFIQLSGGEGPTTLETEVTKVVYRTERDKITGSKNVISQVRVTHDLGTHTSAKLTIHPPTE